MTNIFCIIGPMEAGHLAYIDDIFNDKKFAKDNNLVKLIYGNTKPGVSEPDKYYNMTKEQYEAIPGSDIIEFRSYYMLNYKDDIYYFTRKTDITDKKGKNLICNCSPYQYESYKAWIATENIKAPNSYALYCIFIYSSMRSRVIAMVNKAETDDDIQEICRRVIQEKVEFDQTQKKIPEFFDPMSCENTCTIINDDLQYYADNLQKIKEFISFTIDNNS